MKQHTGEGRGYGYDECVSLPDRTSWDTPPTPQPTHSSHAELVETKYLLLISILFSQVAHISTYNLKDILFFEHLQKIKAHLKIYIYTGPNAGRLHRLP